MKDAIRIVKTAPQVTMSVDSVVYRGLNHIRRNIGKHTSMYTGTAVQDRVVDICCGKSISICLVDDADGDAFDEATANSDAFQDSNVATQATMCLYMDTSYPVNLTINEGEIELKLTKHLFLDHPIRTLTITNEGTSTARVLLAWLYDSSFNTVNC